MDEPLLVARVEVAQAETRLRVVARRIHEPGAVGREHGAHGAAVEVGLYERTAELAVVDRELPEWVLEIVAEAAAVTRHPDVARILPERGAQRVHRRWVVWSNPAARRSRPPPAAPCVQ